MNILNTLPKKTIIFALLLVGLIVFLLFFLFNQKQKNTKNASPIDTPTTTTSQTPPPFQQAPIFRSAFDRGKNTYNLIFEFPERLSFPTIINTAKVDRSINDSYINFLKSKFGIQGNPIVNKSTFLWVSSDQKKSLQIDTESGYIQFSSDEIKTEGERITKEQAKSVAENYLKSFNTFSIAPNSAKITMFEGEKELHPTQNEAQTSFYEISYTESFEGTPIYYHFATPATITVLVDIKSNIRGLRYFQIKPMFTTQIPLISLDQIKKRVTNGEYTIVKISGDPESVPQNGTITIIKASAILFDDKKSSLLSPTVLLEGTLQPSNREVFIYLSGLPN